MNETGICYLYPSPTACWCGATPMCLRPLRMLGKRATVCLYCVWRVSCESSRPSCTDTQHEWATSCLLLVGVTHRPKHLKVLINMFVGCFSYKMFVLKMFQGKETARAQIWPSRPLSTSASSRFIFKSNKMVQLVSFNCKMKAHWFLYSELWWPSSVVERRSLTVKKHSYWSASSACCRGNSTPLLNR